MTTEVGTFGALDHEFTLTTRGPIRVDLGRLFGGLRIVDRPASVAYTVVTDEGGRGALLLDGATIAQGPVRSILQHLIADLGQHALAEPTVAFHASTVGDHRGAVMLVGPSGRGKSTLAARLLIDGMSLVAEDISAVDPSSGAVRPYHRPVGLSRTSSDLLGLPVVDESGVGKMLWSSHDLGFSCTASLPIRHVALVDHTRSDSVDLTPAMMLARLLELGVVSTVGHPDGLEWVVAVLAGASCSEIGTADLDRAVLAVDRHLDAGPPPETHGWLVELRGEATDVFIGTEAVVMSGDSVQHLNASAAAIHLLLTEGRTATQVAAELDLDVADVAEVLRSLS